MMICSGAQISGSDWYSCPGGKFEWILVREGLLVDGMRKPLEGPDLLGILWKEGAGKTE